MLRMLGGDRRQRLAFAAGVVTAVALVFSGALDHPFLPSHDDGSYLLSNPVVRAPAWEAIRGAFTTTPVGAWAPVHLLSHAVDHRVFGEWAGGYVLVNLLLHAVNALLLAWLASRLGARPLAAAAAGLLFAVHPVQVESVAWISQRKTALSLAFMLGCLHLWISFAAAREGRRLLPYALAVVAAGAALLTKAVAVVLPVALALADVPLGRIRGRFRWLAEKLPFVALAAAVVWITVGAKGEIGAPVSVGGHTRAASAGGEFAYHGGSPLATFYTMVTVLPRYLRLLFWPANLSAVYLPPIRTGIDLEVVASCTLLAALMAVGVLLARRTPRLFFWYALFFLGLLPVSQIVPQATLMNDRYLYVPMVGAAGLAGEGLAAFVVRLGGRARRAVLAIAGVALLALALQARARVPVWRSDLALWTDTVAKAPRSPYAWFNLGRAREAAGGEAGALEAYLRAVELDPEDADAVVNAGAILLRQGELSRAGPLVVKGERLEPTSVEAQFNVGFFHFLEGRLASAEESLQTAAALDPAACAPRTLLGHVLCLSGRPGAALERYRDLTARGCSDPELDLYRAFAESESGNAEVALAILAEAIPAAGRLGPKVLQRPTLQVLGAQPRFQALLRRHAVRHAGSASGKR
jgi:hypothetical protein